jgi:hypothetical protein
MRRVLATLTVLALLVVPASTEAKRRSCAMHHAKVVMHVNGITVRYIRDRDEVRTYYGCLRRVGRPFELGSVDENGVERLDSFIAAGPYLAFQGYDGNSSATSVTLARIDLRNGRIRQNNTEFGSYLSASNALEDVVLTRYGALAWIVASSNGFDPLERRVEKLDRDGQVVLDRGPGVDRHSLAATSSGTRLYWTNAGQPRSAALR